MVHLIYTAASEPRTSAPVSSITDPTVLHVDQQVCLLDLDFGLPVQVRDSALGVEKDDIPESDVNKEFKLDQLAESGELGAQYTNGKPNDLILKLQRTTPYYKVGADSCVVSGCSFKESLVGALRSLSTV